MKLVIVCVECGAVEHAPFDGERLRSRELFRAIGWVLSVVNPKEQVMAPLCGECAEKMYPPELMAEVRKRFKA